MSKRQPKKGSAKWRLKIASATLKLSPEQRKIVINISNCSNKGDL